MREIVKSYFRGSAAKMAKTDFELYPHVETLCPPPGIHSLMTPKLTDNLHRTAEMDEVCKHTIHDGSIALPGPAGWHTAIYLQTNISGWPLTKDINAVSVLYIYILLVDALLKRACVFAGRVFVLCNDHLLLVAMIGCLWRSSVACGDHLLPVAIICCTSNQQHDVIYARCTFFRTTQHKLIISLPIERWVALFAEQRGALHSKACRR